MEQSERKGNRGDTMGVRRKLYMLLGVCVLGFVCSFFADRIGRHYADKYRTLEALAANAYVELLQARSEEKNFLIHRTPAAIEGVLRHADKVKADMETLSGLDTAMDGEVRQSLAGLDGYRSGFEELAAIERLKGFDEHAGLMRDFVSTARELDEKFSPVTDKDLQILLLTIRRHEKNWQLRDESAYAVKVGDGVRRLTGMVAANPDLSADQKKSFAAVIDTYQRSFAAYVDASAKAGKTTETMVKNGRELVPRFERIGAAYATRRAEVQTSVDHWLLGIQAALGLVVVFVVMWIIRGITGSLAALGAYSRQVASGNLSARPEGHFEAEFGALRDDTTAMVDNLKEKMGQVEEKQAEAARQAQAAEEAMRETMCKEKELAETVNCMQAVAERSADISRRLSDAARELSAQTGQAASGVEVERRLVDEMASAIEQMNASILEIAANAGAAAKTADQTRDNAAIGAEVVGKAGESMIRVNGIATDLKDDMASLGREARSIGQVVGVINDIADQTNLLALNAAIEAARAGESGRGFAVVADEVRKLAEKTMVATKEVESRIRAIQDATERNITSMDQAVTAVADANALAGQSGEAIEGIVGNADATSGQVQSIATAAEQQSAATEQINRAIGQINKMADNNVAGVEATSQAARALAAMAGELTDLIARMRGDGDEQHPVLAAA